MVSCKWSRLPRVLPARSLLYGEPCGRWPTIPSFEVPSSKQPSDPRDVRTEHGHETDLQRIDLAVRPLAEKLIQEVRQVLPGLETKPTRYYLSLKYHGKLVAALYPRSGGFTLGHYDPRQGAPRGGWVNSPVWRGVDLIALLPKIIERARYLR